MVLQNGIQDGPQGQKKIITGKLTYILKDEAHRADAYHTPSRATFSAKEARSKFQCAAACFKPPPPKGPHKRVLRHAAACFNRWCLDVPLIHFVGQRSMSLANHATFTWNATEFEVGCALPKQWQAGYYIGVGVMDAADRFDSAKQTHHVHATPTSHPRFPFAVWPQCSKTPQPQVTQAGNTIRPAVHSRQAVNSKLAVDARQAKANKLTRAPQSETEEGNANHANHMYRK